MATFRKRNGKWQARVQLCSGPSQARTFFKLQDAKCWARQIEEAYQQGLYQSRPDPITMHDGFARYLKEINVRKKRAHIEQYRIRAWMHHALSHLLLEHIRSHHLARWRDDMLDQGYQANTIRLHLAVLSHLYKVAQSEWGYEDLANPVIHLRRPKLPRVKNLRIEDKAIEELINNTQSLYLPFLIRLALLTAMRRSELIKLCWQDIDRGKHLIHVRDTKNGEDRLIPITYQIADILDTLPQKDVRVFPITEHAVTVAFKRSLKKTNLPSVTFHTLRHEAITRFFEKGFSIPEVASISGHKSWSMLRRYTHFNQMCLKQKMDNVT